MLISPYSASLSLPVVAAVVTVVVVSVKVDGVDYWVSYKWEASKSDDVTVSLDADNVYNVTFNNGSGTVKDADQIAKIAEAAQKEKEAQFQVWWARKYT